MEAGHSHWTKLGSRLCDDNEQCSSSSLRFCFTHTNQLVLEKKMQTVLHHKEFDPTKFTIVWDLDKTLVYAQEWELGSEYFIEFVKRPGINNLLNQLLVEGFQHAVFTAGTQDYLDDILSRFHPMGRYFSNRQFYRHHMVNRKKDLAAVFGPDLHHIVHVNDKALTVVLKEQQKYTILVDAWCGEAESVGRTVANLNKVAPIARALCGFPPSLPCPALLSPLVAKTAQWLKPGLRLAKRGARVKVLEATPPPPPPPPLPQPVSGHGNDGHSLQPPPCHTSNRKEEEKEKEKEEVEKVEARAGKFSQVHQKSGKPLACRRDVLAVWGTTCGPFFLLLITCCGLVQHADF